MIKEGEKIICQNPTPGKLPTRIARWKYELIRGKILDVLSHSEDGILFKDLSRLVMAKLSEQEQNKLGSVSWYTVTVKLDLEARGEIRRVSQVKPQRLMKV